jgi:cytosine/adenosine deaminase-related metal-dependent hydrolase
MIIRSRTVVPMAGEPIDNGAIAIAGNTIVAVGRFDEIRKHRKKEVLDLGERIVLPGLINAHCHLDYTTLRGKIAPPTSFTEWIRAINAEKATLTQDDYVASIREGFAEAQRFGTTTIANLTAFPELAGAIAEPIRTWWFGELIDIRNPLEADRIANTAAAQLRQKKQWGLAPHAPFTASPRLFARCEEIAREENIPLTTHLAESREEMQMFRNGSGPAFDFMQSIGRPMDDCGRETPFSLFKRTRIVDERWIIAHLNELGESDFELLRTERKFHIVHCPRSHTYFNHAPFRLRRLRDLGFNVCLGTDSLASNSDLSLFAEMRELLRKNPDVSPRQVLEMTTVNGAAALGQEGKLGCITSGAAADLIALPGSKGDLFENIVAFEGPVPWMMMDGAVADVD